MDEQNVKRTRRTPQQMVEDIDGKIQKLNQDLEALAAKKIGRASCRERV